MLVNLHEAKTNLSRLVRRAEAGEEIVIGRAGVPVAKLVAWRPDGSLRRPGVWRGRVKIGADFDDLPDEVGAALRGERP